MQHPALPRDGTSSASDWLGWIPPAEVPAYSIPPGGAVVSANHATVAGDYPHYVSHLYEPDYRARRIQELLAARGDLVAEDFARIQRDAFSLAARAHRKAVFLPHAEAVRRSRPHVARALDLLLSWEGDESEGARGAGLWHLVHYHLARRLFGAGLPGALVEQWMSLVNLMDATLLEAFTDPESPWAPPAIRATLVGEAIEQALADLAARGLPLDAPWGALHTLTLRHPLGHAPLLGRAVNQGPFPMPGGPYAPCSGQYLHHRPAAMVVGASYRQVVDLADPEGEGRMITFGGQSGWCGSPHYADLTALWRRGAWLPMRIESAPDAGDVLRLVPA